MLRTQAALGPPSRRRQQGHFFMAVTLNPGHKLYQRSWERLFCVSGAHVRSRPLWRGQLALVSRARGGHADTQPVVWWLELLEGEELLFGALGLLVREIAL